MKWLVGDVIEQTNLLEPASVDLVLTSPPFLALRSYLPADHPDKPKEGGSQATPGEYIDWLIDVVEALDRVLAPHGSMVVELGDTYCGAGGYGDPGAPNPAYGDGERFAERWEGRTTKRFKRENDGWPASKSLTLIPELFRLTLVYGFNPLTGRTTRPWRLRNVVRWVRPNPPVGALGDKFRPATSELAVLCRTDKAGQNRFFDLDAVRVPSTTTGGATGFGAWDSTNDKSGVRRKVENTGANPAGAPPLDWINQPPGGYSGAHYAVWPPALLPVFIKSMCPIGGTVLDPFAGSGTTLAVALGHGRNAIGIDLDPRNRDLAYDRIGPLIFQQEET